MQIGSLVICKADITDHKWMLYKDGISVGYIEGPNKDEICLVEEFSNGDLVLFEYSAYSKQYGCGYPRDEFEELQPPMDIQGIVEESIKTNIYANRQLS